MNKLEEIRKHVDELSTERKRKTKKRIRTRLNRKIVFGVLSVLIAGALITSAGLLSYYGKIETTATVSQSVLLDGKDYTTPATHAQLTAIGGCCEYRLHELENQGCLDASIHYENTIRDEFGGCINPEGVTITLINTDDNTDIENDFILKAGETLNFNIRYCFAINIIPEIYIITTEFQPGTPVNSGTMVFQASFGSDPLGGGQYILPMIDESATGLGDGIAGFDVYAMNSAIAAYDKAGSGSEDYAHGPVSGHDAYTTAGGWGTWCDPDCADWNHYQLHIDGNNWYVEYYSGSTTYAAPMSGTIDKTNTYMTETGVGAYYSGMGTPENDGYALSNPWTVGDGSQAWDMDWSWGSEYIPLEHAGFSYNVDVDGNVYTITLTPEAE